MKDVSTLGLAALLGMAISSAASAATLAGVGEFEGVAAVGTPDGVVVAPPNGEGFVYVTTDGSSATAGYGIGGETNGSKLTTNSFSANAGSMLEYYFNYVTSDGSGFADYAYATLNNLMEGTSINLFNARTTPTGNTVPGFGLPDIDPGSTLTPAETPIISGGPLWSALGGSSGACFGAGCGYTGWVKSDFTIETAGTYSFTFGVTNWTDTLFQSAFAISGLKIDGEVIIDPNVVPLPAGAPLLLGGLGLLAVLRRRKSA